MKVKQLQNKNQFLMEDEKKIIFQSYESTIAEYDKKKEQLTIGRHWDYSKTTAKHFYIFIDEILPYNENTKEIIQTKNETNRKKAIQKLIDKKIVKYKKEMI